MQIFTELWEVKGSVKDAAKYGRPVTVTGKTTVSKVREIIESDGRYTIRDIAY